METAETKTQLNLRTDDRNPITVDVVCQPYGSSRNPCLAQGVMRNFSSQGSYVEIDRQFKSGTILIVRTVGCRSLPSESNKGEEPRSICLGEIKWRQDVDCARYGYGIGLRYLD